MDIRSHLHTAARLDASQPCLVGVRGAGAVPLGVIVPPRRSPPTPLPRIQAETPAPFPTLPLVGYVAAYRSLTSAVVYLPGREFIVLTLGE